MGGWIGLTAVLFLGARSGRYSRDGQMQSSYPPSSIPFLALGAWILSVGWFGFNVMSAQSIDKISGLVAINSLMAMAGGTLAALAAGKNDPGFVHNGPLAAWLRSAPDPTWFIRSGAGDRRRRGRRIRLRVTLAQNRLKIDRRAGRVAAARLCGAWAASPPDSSVSRRWRTGRGVVHVAADRHVARHPGGRDGRWNLMGFSNGQSASGWIRNRNSRRRLVHSQDLFNAGEKPVP